MKERLVKGFLPLTHYSAPRVRPLLHARVLAVYALEFLVIGIAYFVLAKMDMILVAMHPSAIAISVAPGFALAAVLLRGPKVGPAILAAALAARAPTAIADVTTADTALNLSIAGVNALESVVGGYLLNVWVNGRKAFQAPAGAVKFATISLGPSTLPGATASVGVMCLVGHAAWSNFSALWVTSWLRDACGTLVITPAIVMWAADEFRSADREKRSFAEKWESAGAFLAAGTVGFLTFSPLLEPTVNRSALGILAVSPLLWSALRCGQRDTTMCMLILAGFAAWSAWAGNSPFAIFSHISLLTSSIFLISASGFSLILSANIAQRRSLETKLREREQSLRTLLNRADVGIAQIDATGRFRLVNSRYCDMVQRSAAALRQLRIYDLIETDDFSHMLDFLGRASDPRERFTIETKTLLPDGAGLLIRYSFHAIFDPSRAAPYFAVVAEDVTAQRQADENLMRERQRLTATLRNAGDSLRTEIDQRNRLQGALEDNIIECRKLEEALAESEWRFQIVSKAIADYAIFTLDREGRITHWNVGAQRILQYSAAEMIGRSFSLFYSEDEQRGGEPARALKIAAYEGKYAIEGWRIRRDENRFWASIVIEAIRDEAGALVGFVNIIRDISERREAQASLQHAQDQLAQSQKMEALGHLTGSIAHDFNNLLMIVSGHAQLLRRWLTDPKHLHAIEAVNSAANRGASLTRQLLAFSRRQPVDPVVTDLKERIEAVHEMLVGSLRGNVRLQCNIAADVWPIEVDVAELELALVNVVVNARDAMPDGGVIKLSASNVTLAKNDGIDQLEGDFVALAITDTGVGIAPEVLPRVFEPFFTTKTLGKGTGLGLAQVYGFSHQSGGSVVATSTIGGGTTMTIYLPRKDAAVVKTEAPSHMEAIVPRQGVILVVEDNPQVADVTTALVEQLGYPTVRADNAAKALNLLQHEDKIILVLSDVIMPGSMNGIALAQEVVNRYPRIPVLLASGYSDVIQSASSQFQILRKPFQLSALQKSISAALELGRDPEDDDRVLQFPSGVAWPKGNNTETSVR